MMHAETESPGTARAARPLRPYEFIATPPIALVLNAILDQCIIGSCITPGVRVLADESGVSRGLITDCLRQLAADGWILYDGRTITLLRDPDSEPEPDRSPDRSLDKELIDQVIDQSVETPYPDRSGDRSLLEETPRSAIDRVPLRPRRNRRRDRSPDRSESPPRPPMVLTKLTTGIAVVRDSGGCGGTSEAQGGVTQAPDRVPGVARVLAELGADPKIIADALRERPDLTSEQVRETWAWHQERIAQSDGKLNEGVFYHAIRRGQLHAAPPDPALPLDPLSYAGDPAFKLGSDVSPPSDAQQRETAYHDAHWRAVALLGPGAPFREMAVLVERLVAGDSDEAALAALEERRSAVRR